MPALESPLGLWRKARELNPMEVAWAIAREAFLAMPALTKIAFDFSDCEGIPYIWLTASTPEDPEACEALSMVVGGSGPFSLPENFPSFDLEAIATEILHDQLAYNPVFTRAKALSSPVQEPA